MIAKNSDNFRWSHFVIAWILLPVVATSIKFKGFVWTCERLLRDPFKELPKTMQPRTLKEIEDAKCIHGSVLRAGRYWPHKKNNCLQRATLACFFVRLKQIPCRIRLGVNGDDPADMSFAHAWIEVNGNPIGESKGAMNNFQPFVSERE